MEQKQQQKCCQLQLTGQCGEQLHGRSQKFLISVSNEAWGIESVKEVSRRQV